MEIEIKEKFSLGHPAGYDVYVFEIKYCKNETPVQAADYLGQDFNAKYRTKHFQLTKPVNANFFKVVIEKYSVWISQTPGKAAGCG